MSSTPDKGTPVRTRVVLESSCCSYPVVAPFYIRVSPPHRSFSIARHPVHPISQMAALLETWHGSPRPLKHPCPRPRRVPCLCRHRQKAPARPGAIRAGRHNRHLLPPGYIALGVSSITDPTRCSGTPCSWAAPPVAGPAASPSWRSTPSQSGDKRERPETWRRRGARRP
jgi:hypothetical protein